MNIFLIIVLTGFCFGFTTLLNTLKDDKHKKIAKWIVYGIFCFSFMWRVLLNDQFRYVEGVFNPYLFNGDNLYSHYYVYVIVFILRTLTFGCAVSVIVSSVFKNKNGKRINAYIVPVVYLLNIIFYNVMVKSLALPTNDKYVGKCIFFAFECISGILLSYVNKRELGNDKPNKKEWVNVFLLLIGCCACGSHNSFLYNLMGNCLPVVEMFNFWHIVILILPIILFIFLYFLLRKKSDYDKWYALMLLTLGIFVRHWYLYEINIYNLPLALCHLGCCFLPIGIATKNKTLMYFCLTNSVIGAITALAIPGSVLGTSIATPAGTHFVSNHVLLLVFPVLASVLGVIPPMKFKDLKNVFITNIIYYVIVVICSILIPDTSYFFFNNTELIENMRFIVDLMPLRDGFILNFDLFGIHCIVYYVYWIIMFVFLNILTFAGYGFYKLEVLVGRLLTHKKKVA